MNGAIPLNTNDKKYRPLKAKLKRYEDEVKLIRAMALRTVELTLLLWTGTETYYLEAFRCAQEIGTENGWKVTMYVSVRRRTDR